jgi:GR25 family glycosyltransferase involved in LPS biosynthesis
MILEEQPKTFVIAIKGHTVSETQLSQCIDSGTRYNWKINTFWGIDGRSITDDTWKNENIVPRLDKPTMFRRGVQGCFLSHWKLWNYCIELNEPIIILEHDAIIQDYWQSLEISDSIIKLHRYYKEKNPKYDEDTGLWSASGHAYCLLPKHATILVEFVKHKGAFEVDRIIGDKVIPFKHLGKPSLVERQNSFSTTENI